MGRYFIEDIKSGTKNGGRTSVVSVKVKDEGRVFYLTYIRIFVYTCFYLTDSDYFDWFLAEDVEDTEDDEYIKEMEMEEMYHIDEFDGVALFSEPEDFFEELKRCEGNEAASLIRYLHILSFGIKDGYNEYAERGLNKFISDIDIPLLDVDDYEDID